MNNLRWSINRWVMRVSRMAAAVMAAAVIVPAAARLKVVAHNTQHINTQAVTGGLFIVHSDGGRPSARGPVNAEAGFYPRIFRI